MTLAGAAVVVALPLGISTEADLHEYTADDVAKAVAAGMALSLADQRRLVRLLAAAKSTKSSTAPTKAPATHVQPQSCQIAANGGPTAAALDTRSGQCTGEGGGGSDSPAECHNKAGIGTADTGTDNVLGDAGTTEVRRQLFVAAWMLPGICALQSWPVGACCLQGAPSADGREAVAVAALQSGDTSTGVQGDGVEQAVTEVEEQQAAALRELSEVCEGGPGCSLLGPL
jgi:hypothetical protein